MTDRSQTRERQAQQTREHILLAARQLFAERGYARTTVRDVARAAGVSAQTVYDSVGSKQALVARLNDVIDSEAGIPELGAGVGRSDDPAQVAATSARITRSIVERCGDIVRTLAAGADAEPELAAVMAEGQRRHLAGATLVTARVRELGALADGDPDAAAASLAAITDVRIALVLHDHYGWTLDRVEEWMAARSRAVVLDGA
jgi:AcrR family transcriptional regulator